ncbi:MAG: hypothetical protein HYX35_03420 [Proteobacteria bacterium]|nr:hypothetical protein [Pseudomonadota bacterium]
MALSLISTTIGDSVFAEKQNNAAITKTTASQKSLLHGIAYKWYLPPSMKESELINDFKTLKNLAAQHGALSSQLFRTSNKNEYIGLQYWPSFQIYNAWFDQKHFRFRHPQSKQTMDLMTKIQNVYKNQFLGEITEII